MRLKLTLQHHPNQVLPINYQYLISSWVYRTLESANAEFATQLHEQGYSFRGKQYKLFTFDSLRPRWFDINKKARTFILAKVPTTLELSFYIDEAIQHFVVGLFKDQQFSLSSGTFLANFEVTGIETLAKPRFQNTMRFRLKTPLCISQNVAGEKYPKYISPETTGYAELLVKNLLRKQQALQLQATGQEEESIEIDFPYNFKLLSTPKSKLYTIKGIDIRGYLFDFELTAIKELMEMGYFSGFGEKNSSLGMGMVYVLK